MKPQDTTQTTGSNEVQRLAERITEKYEITTLTSDNADIIEIEWFATLAAVGGGKWRVSVAQEHIEYERVKRYLDEYDREVLTEDELDDLLTGLKATLKRGT